VNKILFLLLALGVVSFVCSMDSRGSSAHRVTERLVWQDSCEYAASLAAFDCFQGIVCLVGAHIASLDTPRTLVRTITMRGFALGSLGWFCVGCWQCARACKKPSYIYERFARRPPSYEPHMD